VTVVGLLFVPVVLIAMLGYSLSWEVVRLVRAAEPHGSSLVRGALQVGAFFSVVAVWPLLAVGSLIRYRTAWPVSAGRLRLRPTQPLWWRAVLCGMCGLWVVASAVLLFASDWLYWRNWWQIALHATASAVTVVIIGLCTDELPKTKNSDQLASSASSR
jgi:hypothetical protein